MSRRNGPAESSAPEYGEHVGEPGSVSAGSPTSEDKDSGRDATPLAHPRTEGGAFPNVFLSPSRASNARGFPPTIEVVGTRS